MKQLDASPDTNDHELDGPLLSNIRLSPRATLIEMLTWMVAGIWLGSKVVAEFVLYPEAHNALFNIMHAGHTAGPIAGLVYAYVSKWSDSIAGVCGILLLLNSVLDLVVARSRRFAHIIVALLYGAALGLAIVSANSHLDMYMVSYGQMEQVAQDNMHLTIAQLGCLLCGIFLRFYLITVEKRLGG